MKISLLSAAILAFNSLLLHSPAGFVHASTPSADSVHFHEPFDYEQWRHDHPLPAAKPLADLKVGEPRTVRMIYFLPNDRPYRMEVVQDMKDRIHEVQTFYAASMGSRGYEDRTFRFETEAEGEPFVNRVDGQHSDSHYIDDTSSKVLDEIRQAFDLEKNIYLVVIDISTDVIDRLAGGIAFRSEKVGGFALITSDEMDPFNYHNVVSHELGHAFGLQHDFRDRRYVMSYGNWPESQLSACNAEFLAVNPYFDPAIPIDAGPSPTIERTSTLNYPEEAKSISIQLEVSDASGLHQVILFARGIQVKSCRRLEGERHAVVAFDYNGVIPVEVEWGVYTSLALPPRHPIWVRAVDRAGNANQLEFVLEADRGESRLTRPHRLVKISGDNQQGEPGSSLATPLSVEVRDQFGNPLPDARVTFSVSDGGGKLNGRFSLENLTTGADGRAELVLTLGPRPGTNAVKVSVGEHTETFHAVGQGEPVAPPSLDGAASTWHLPDGATLRLGTGRIQSNERAVGFSPDGQLFAVARNNGIWLYDARTYRPISFLPAEEKVSGMAFSRDGTRLAWTQWFNFDHPNTIKVWDLAAGLLTTAFGVGTVFPKSVVFSPEGTLLAVGGGLTNSVFLFGTETWRSVAEYPGIGVTNILDEPFSISFSPDGRLLASGSSDKAIGLWDVTTHTKVATLEGHTYPVASTAFSPDGSLLASGSWDRTVKLWDVATQEIVGTLEGHTDRVLSVAFSGEGTTLASASGEGSIKLWDVATRENTATLEGDAAAISSVAFARDGTLVSGHLDGSVKFWDASARGVVHELEGATAVTSAAFSGDGTILVLGSDDRTVKVRNLQTGLKAGTLEGHTSAVTSVAFLPDGTTLVTGGNQEVKLWHAPTRSDDFSLKAEYFRAGCGIFYIIPSPDGTKIASGGPNEIVLWDLATGAQTATAASTTTLSFSPDGGEIISKSFDGFIELWDVTTLENTGRIPIGHTSVDVGGGFVLFSPDGTLFATGTDYVDNGHIVGSVKLWDTVTKENIATFEEHDGQIKSGAFSPDGSLLASGSYYGVIKLWDILNRESVATLEGHAGSVSSLSFSPDGTVLASGSEDGTVLLWDMELVLPHPETLTKLSGVEQEGPAGTVLAQPFVVLVQDQNGDPFAGTTVTFAVTAGEGTLSVTHATTDAEGLAATTLTLGREPETVTVVATVAELDPVTFTATGLAIPQTLAKLSGDEEEGVAGAALSEPFVVEVRDQNGTPLAGTTVTFAITSGGGTLSATSATTDADGRASITLTLGSELGVNTVTVTVSGLDPVTFTATAEAATPDFDGDGETDFSDFFLFADAFGGSDPRFDLDGSGSVDFGDFFLLADHFGEEARGKLLALAHEMIGLPDGPLLLQNAPNPFNSETVITWFQLQPGLVRLEVFALTGQRVAVLHEGPEKAGPHRVHWDGLDDQGRPLASGLYLYRLSTDKSLQTLKLTLLR